MWPIFAQCGRKRRHSDISSDLDPELVVSPIPQLDGPPPSTPRANSLEIQAPPTPGEAVSADVPPQPDSHAQDDHGANSGLTILEKLDLIAAGFERLYGQTELHGQTGQDESSEEETGEDDDHLSDLIDLVRRQKTRKHRKN